MRAFLCLALLIFLSSSCLPAHAQFEQRWVYGASGIPSDGLRSYITGVDAMGSPVRDPGFEPGFGLSDDSGAYLFLAVNAGGGAGRPFLQSLLDLPWGVPRGFQVIRLDAQGEVLWHRFLRQWPNDIYALVPAMTFPAVRLVPGGGLLVETQGGLLIDAQGTVQSASALAPDDACLDEAERTTAQYRGYAMAEVGRLARWYVLPGSPAALRLCVFDLATGIAHQSTEPLGLDWRLLNQRSGVGAIFSHEQSAASRLLQMRRDGALIWEVESRSNAGVPRILADGSTWVAIAGGWRRIGADGELLGQFLETTELAPTVWLDDGTVVFSDLAEGRVRRVSPSGLTLWELEAGVSLLGSAWHPVGSHLYAVPEAPQTGPAQVLQIELVSGQISSAAAVSDSELTWLPLPSGRYLSVRPGQPDASLAADSSVCGVSFTYCPLAQDLVSQHVFDFGPVHGTRTHSFELPGEALALDIASAVHPVAGSRDVILVDRVFDGAKHVPRATRINAQGRKVWERVLPVDRSGARDVVAGSGESGVFVTARTGWPTTTSAPRPVWKIDGQGKIAWRIETAEPLTQLVAMSNGDSERMCGLSTGSDSAAVRQAWVCLDSTDGTESVFVLDHPPGWRAALEGVVEGRAHVRLFPGSPPTHDQFDRVEIDFDGAQSNLRGLAFEPSPTGRHRALVSYLAGSTSYALANEHTDSDGDSPASEAILAAFSSDGTRLWQKTIPGPFRFSEKGVTTGPEIRRAANGDVLVSLLVRGPLVDGRPSFPFALCRFSALGDDLGCTLSGVNGRPIDFVVPSVGEEVFVWLLNYDASTRTVLQLVPWASAGFGAAVIEIPGYVISAHGAVRQQGDEAWAVATLDSAFGAGLVPDPEPSLLVVSASFSALFANGFE